MSIQRAGLSPARFDFCASSVNVIEFKHHASFQTAEITLGTLTDVLSMRCEVTLDVPLSSRPEHAVGTNPALELVTLLG